MNTMNPKVTEAIIGAGTTLSFQDPAKKDEFVELTEAIAVGAIGSQGSFVDVSPMKAKTDQFIPGTKTPPDKQIVGNDVPDDAAQQKFLKLAEDSAIVTMKVVYSNGRTGTFSVALAGWQMNDPDRKGALQWTVFGKQSGDPIWTESTDNKVGAAA